MIDIAIALFFVTLLKSTNNYCGENLVVWLTGGTEKFRKHNHGGQNDTLTANAIRICFLNGRKNLSN